jgi:uncharacterized protein
VKPDGITNKPDQGLPQHERPCLAVMLKYPDPGKVKTRLGREIGMEQAAGLYSCFVLRLLAECRNTGHEIMLCCHPGRDISHYQAWLGQDYIYTVQAGGDLGQKMLGCFEQAFEYGFTFPVLMGSDIPGLDRRLIFRALEESGSRQSVIGPSSDGGYYLIGVNRRNFRPDFFRNIPWSTSGVLNMTMKKLSSAGLKPFILPVLTDVDTLDDLKHVFSDLGLPATPDELLASIEKYCRPGVEPLSN